MDFGIQVSGRTLYTSLSTGVAVVAILGLYAVLVPPLAGLGAALATIGGFTVRGVLYRVFAQREFPIDYRPARAVVLVLLGSAVAAGVVVWNPAGLLAELGAATAAVALYGALVLTLVLHADERATLMMQLARLRGRFVRA